MVEWAKEEYLHQSWPTQVVFLTTIENFAMAGSGKFLLQILSHIIWLSLGVDGLWKALLVYIWSTRFNREGLPTLFGQSIPYSLSLLHSTRFSSWSSPILNRGGFRYTLIEREGLLPRSWWPRSAASSTSSLPPCSHQILHNSQRAPSSKAPAERHNCPIFTFQCCPSHTQCVWIYRL